MPLLFIFGIIAVAGILGLLLIWQIIFLLQGPPYVPTDDETLRDMVAIAKKYHPKRILDMGSGDGRLVIALAKAGFTADGIEMNRVLVRRSKKALQAARVKNVSFTQGNFWKFPVGEYDMVVLYVIKHIMPKLQEKLQNELPKDAYIVSNFFVFPGVKPVAEKNRVKVYQLKNGKFI